MGRTSAATPATAYPIDASGDIRAAAHDPQRAGVGAVADDRQPRARSPTTRSARQILVPNCVAHPQIAVFARLADGNAARDSRDRRPGDDAGADDARHRLRRAARRDRDVPQQFGQAILIFRAICGREKRARSASSRDRSTMTDARSTVWPSIRSTTRFTCPKAIDVLVFDLQANGNVAPKRVLGGPDTGFTAAGSAAIDPTRNIDRRRRRRAQRRRARPARSSPSSIARRPGNVKPQAASSPA